MDESDVLLKLADCEMTVDSVEKEIEQYRIEKMKPIYRKRDDLINQIPGFWKIVLSQHADFANYVRASDFTYVDVIDKLKVDMKSPDEFSITIGFSAIDGDFEKQTVVKHFQRVKNPNVKEDEDEEEDSEILVSEAVDIKWPKTYNKINPDLIEDKKSDVNKKNYRTGMKSLFGWFRWTGKKPGKEFPHGDAFANVFVDDLYPYCVKYYTEAHRDLEDENDDDSEDSEEELDLPELKKQKL